MLKNIKIVLVETSHPGNIGSVARIMKNMGLEQLVLVKPKLFPHADATTLASGADDILQNATIVDSLDEALNDVQNCFGTSARSRHIEWPLLMPDKAAQIACQQGSTGQVALVFGRERIGLTNEELSRCQYHIWIPSEESFSSLNLASAVVVCSYALKMASISELQPAARELAPMGELEQFYQHLDETLSRLQFLRSNNHDVMMLKLRRLFNRAKLDAKEVTIMRGVLAAMDKYAHFLEKNG